MTPDASLAPSEVRERILGEHEALRERLTELTELVTRDHDDEAQALARIRAKLKELYETLAKHIDLEDAILAPALRETDAYGPDRADSLLSHHREQRRDIARALDALVQEQASLEELTREVKRFDAELRGDMEHEEKAVLDPKLLRDDPINVDMFTG
jgi:iron-sulfur cluster repair protein YtfE (RIC family)